MASHCHHRHHHCCTAAAGSNCYCCCGCPGSPPQPPPATAAADPLILQAIAAQLLQSPLPPTYTNQYLESLHYLYSRPSPAPSPDLRLHQLPQKQTKQHPHREKHSQHQGHNDLVESLLQRISALESSIPQTRPCTAPSPDSSQTALPRPHPSGQAGKDPVPRAAPPRRVVSSVRDAAARTIQAQFRLYLIRRSQTLRDLKQLAIIRSEVEALKTSLRRGSRQPHRAELKAVQSRRALDLLEKLDCIQSSDRMIKEGKRSIRLELIAITKLTDGAVNGLAFDSFEEQQSQPHQFSRAATRRVTFADSSNEGDSRASEDDDLYVEGDEEEEGNCTIDDDNETNYILKKKLDGNGGKPGLHAPLPVKMESRRNESDEGTNGN